MIAICLPKSLWGHKNVHYNICASQNIPSKYQGVFKPCNIKQDENMQMTVKEIKVFKS